MLAPIPRVQLFNGQAHYLLGQLNEAEKDLQSASAAGDQQLKAKPLSGWPWSKKRRGKSKRREN